MRRGLLAAVLLCSASMALPACSFVNDADDHQRGGGLEPVAPSEFCAELSELVCSAHLDCCPTATLDLNDCVSAFTSGCASEFGAIAADPRAGYDPLGAAEVLRQGREFAQGCDPAVASWITARSGLLSVFAGTVEGGGTCTPNSATDFAAFFSCQETDQACVQVSADRWICADRLGVGESCTADTDCLDGLWCDGAGLFVAGSCAERRVAGEPCPKNQACQSLACATPADGGTEGTCVEATADAVYCGLDGVL